MKRVLFLFLIFSVGCAPLKKGLLKAPVPNSDYTIDYFFANISEQNRNFKGLTGTGRITLEEGKYQWSAIFKLYISSRDSAKISIYGPLGMKVFTVFVNGDNVSFDRKTDYEAIANLLKSADLVGNTFTSILSSIPLIDTQTVRIDSTRAIMLQYSDLAWFYSPKAIYPDSLYIKNDSRISTIVKYYTLDNTQKPYSADIYSTVFDAHLKIHFDRVKRL